jgi:secreted Zn-dependent insulinase-like peptidase
MSMTEIINIHRQFEDYKTKESRRIYQVEKSIISTKGCVIHRHGEGNLESLKVTGIHDKLLQFY